MSSSSSSSSMLSSSKMSTSEMSSQSPSMTANVNQYVETTTTKDDKVTIPPAALSFSESSSFTKTAPSMSSSNTSTLTSSTMPEEIEYTESSTNDNTVKIPPVAIDSSLSSKVLKTNSDLPESKIIASEKMNTITNIESIKPSSAHIVTATLKNQESYVMQESTQKIEEIKKTEQERINKIQLETSEKLRVVEQKQRETQEYLREAEICKSLLITKEQQLNKMCDQEKLLIDEIERKQRELSLKQSEIESFRVEVIDIKRRASAAQAKAELIATEAPAIVEKTTIETKTSEKSSDSSSEAPSKLSSIGSSIKSMFGMGSSAESTSEESQHQQTSTTTVKQQKYTQSA